MAEPDYTKLKVGTRIRCRRDFDTVAGVFKGVCPPDYSGTVSQRQDRLIVQEKTSVVEYVGVDTIRRLEVLR